MDRFDYNSAIAESWKQQTLLNIVKLRYMDLPVFVDVSSIVAGYSMETDIGAGGQFYPTAGNAGYAAVTAKGTFTDRPTVTYTPMTGDRFLRGVLKPLEPKNIFSMVQSGYPADFVLGLTVESLNGLRNRTEHGGVVQEAQAEFGTVLRLLREVQLAGGVGLRVVESRLPDGEDEAELFFRSENVTPEVRDKTNEIRRLLHLPLERERFRLIFSPARGAATELAVNSRSMMQIMATFSTYVDVPEEHLAEHLTLPMFEHLPEEQRKGAPLRIHSGKSKPAVSYAAVRYRDHWYWIDDDDWHSKRAVTSTMFFFTLEDASGGSHAPVVTIPAQ